MWDQEIIFIKQENILWTMTLGNDLAGNNKKKITKEIYSSLTYFCSSSYIYTGCPQKMYTHFK